MADVCNNCLYRAVYRACALHRHILLNMTATMHM